MDSVIGEVLPLAFGVAISPMPIAAIIVMLMTPAARTNGPIFLAAWMSSLAVIGVVVFLLPGLETSTGEPTRLAGVLRGVLGLLLVGVAVRQWRSRPKTGESITLPPWMAKIDGFGPAQSAGLGILMSAVNPKNLVLTAAAAATIDESQLLPAQQAIGLMVFVALASVTVAVPVLSVLALGKTADESLASAKDWLIAKNAVVMAVLMLVFGVVLVVGAIGILAK
jgi:hypothetical protein